MARGEVFVDSGGFLALWDASDEHHGRAVALREKLALERRRLVTTDYVVDESATLLLVRHSHEAATDFVRTVEESRWLRLEWTGAERFRSAAALFRTHDDKEWSYTDCVSFVTMKELRIRDAFATDRHFQQAGFTALLHD